MRIPEKKPNEYSFLARIIFWAQKRKYGQSLLPSKLWGRSSPLIFGLQVFYRTIDRKSSPLEPALRALLNVKVSQINHCAFCSDISQSLLLKHGITADKIEALKDFNNSNLFTEKEKAALDYAVAITYSDKTVTNEIFSELKKHFNDDAIVELTALIGYQNLSSKFNAALDIPSQGFCKLPPKD